MLAVDKDSVGGIGIGNGPAAVVITGQNTVAAGHGRYIHHNITASAATDHILPVGDGQLGAVLQA